MNQVSLMTKLDLIVNSRGSIVPRGVALGKNIPGKPRGGSIPDFLNFLTWVREEERSLLTVQTQYEAWCRVTTHYFEIVKKEGHTRTTERKAYTLAKAVWWMLRTI